MLYQKIYKENCCEEGNKSSKFSEAHYYAIRHSKWSFNLLSWILLLLHCMEEECTTEYILLPKAISWRSTKEPSLSCNLIPSIADPFLHTTFLPSKCSFQKAIWALCVLCATVLSNLNCKWKSSNQRLLPLCILSFD